MAPREKAKAGTPQATAQEPKAPKLLPRTTLSGVNAEPSHLMTVMVTAMVETTGQVRFGDGTDIDTTITEKDWVVLPDGDRVLKYVWAGTKRRGVDRRVIHELRNVHRPEFTACYIGNLCGQCPLCWLYGFTGTTGAKGSPVKDINAKSRILYATSVSVEGLGDFPTNRHARNAVDERTQKTGTAASGESGIHREEFIPEGIHFPVYTAAVRVLPWEFGAFAHGLLESLNSNRYTAGSRAMGGMKFADVKAWPGPALIVDVSPDGVFPLAAPKVASSELTFGNALNTLTGMVTESNIHATLAAMGFEKGQAFQIGFGPGVLTVKQGETVLMTRYWGERARGYLESQRLAYRDYLTNGATAAFWANVEPYVNVIRGKPEAAPEGEGGENESYAEPTG